MSLIEQIQQAEQQLMNAQLAGDTAVLDALIADDLVFVGPDGGLYDKVMDLEAHRSGTSRITALVPDEPVINLQAAFAIVSVVVALQGIFGGQSMGGRFRYLRVWSNRDGQWQIVAGSCTAVQS